MFLEFINIMKYLEKVLHKFSNWDEVKEAAALGLLNLEVINLNL